MDVNDSNESRFSIERLLRNVPPQPDFVIDGIHFGRGCYYEGIEYKTINVTCWRIVDEELQKLPQDCREFFDDETYIVRKNYKVNTHNDYLYFFWKGHTAPKGLSPLPKEIEAENPPVERICQWSEPTAFLQLFKGKFVVHNKKFVRNETRLYMLRGELKDEAHLYEVAPETASLRSRTSFLVCKGRNVTIWHGRRCPQQSRLVIKNFVEKNCILKEVEEDTCRQEDLFDIIIKPVASEVTLKILEKTPRLFYCNTITGSFLASEIECPHRSKFVTPFPFLQEHLYSAPQPAVFLLVDDLDLWIWQGCNVADDDLSNKRYEDELKQLLKAIEEYKAKENVYLIYGGVEPVEFMNLFPFWIQKNDVTQVQFKNGRRLGEKVIISEGTA